MIQISRNCSKIKVRNCKLQLSKFQNQEREISNLVKILHKKMSFLDENFEFASECRGRPAIVCNHKICFIHADEWGLTRFSMVLSSTLSFNDVYIAKEQASLQGWRACFKA